MAKPSCGGRVEANEFTSMQKPRSYGSHLEFSTDYPHNAHHTDIVHITTKLSCGGGVEANEFISMQKP